MARMIPIASILPHSRRNHEGSDPLDGFGADPKLLKDAVVAVYANTLWVLMGNHWSVLLIACANVANLFLVRMEGRRRELASPLGAWGRPVPPLPRGLLPRPPFWALPEILGYAVAYAGLRCPCCKKRSANLPRAGRD